MPFSARYFLAAEHSGPGLINGRKRDDWALQPAVRSKQLDISELKARSELCAHGENRSEARPPPT